MSLMPRLSSFFQVKYLYCAPLLWLSLQLKGYYWLLILLLLFALFRLKDSLASIIFVGRQAVLTALLLVFSFSLLTAATVELGFKGLISEIPISLPIVPIFMFSCVAFRRSPIQGLWHSFLWAYPLVIASSISLQAIVSGFLLYASPASSLRPLEIQGSSGIFLLTSIIITAHFLSPNVHVNKRSYFYISTFSLLLALAGFVCFRGLTSSAALLANLLSMSILHFFTIVRRMHPFLLVSACSVFAFVLSLFVDFRFLILRYILAPFVSGDIGNGRLTLLHRWLADHGQSPPALLGPHSSVPIDFFAHNLFLDSLIKDGILAASALLLYCTLSFVFLVRDFCRYYDKYRFLNLLLFLLMSVPALLQPVQFAHAFCFLLSIATVGVLTSMSVGQPLLER